MLTTQVFNMNQQIIFIDSSVSDYQTLLGGADPQAEIVILDANCSGIEQITETLTAKQNVEAVHIISHGSEGNLQLGSDILNGKSLESFSSRLQQWRNVLTEEADILLYGCDVAAGEIGETFIQRFSEITGADVAASTDLTGNAALGGNWQLEKTTGSIEASIGLSQEAMTTYTSILPTAIQFDFTSVFDSDVITNYTGGVTDTTQDPLGSSPTQIDTLITQSFATFQSAANGNGLPDNGSFAANAYHPAVQLGYNNTNNGNNAKLLITNGTSFTFAVTPNQYSAIHLFATSTNGAAGMQVTFNYSDGTTGTSTATVDDWFNEITTESFSKYYLIDGMDQRTGAAGTTYQNANDPAIFGFGFNPNPAKTLQSITVTKTSGGTVDNRLGIFGATGVVGPTVALTSTAAATVNAPFAVTATFSENTTNFIASDISLTNGTVSGFTGSGTTYTFTVTPTSQGTVTVNVPTGVATDAAGNNNTAATALTRTFDTTAPTASFTPADNATGVAVTANLVVTLSEAIQKGTGNIVIKKVSDNSVVETIDVTSVNVTVTGSSVTVNPTANLVEGTDYYVEIANGAIQDLAGNNYAGTTGATAWNFTTAAAPDTTPPTASFTPVDNATGVAVTANLVVTLSEAVQKGTGNIVIKKVSDNSVVETIDVTSVNVTVTGSSVTVNPTANLVEGTDYYVEIANGAIQDLAGNNYAGTTGATAWNFTTAAAPDT
ncbi:DUF4347 domain-containing protein, partial [Microcoleus sp. AT9_B5]